jgi:hypothetical protein
MSKKNQYEQQSNKKSLLGATEEAPTANLSGKATFLEVTKDVLLGVVGGGYTGSYIGKPAFFLGLALTAYGHYNKNRLVTMFGFGMMASPLLPRANNAAKADQSFSDAAKDRVSNFTDILKEKLFLDKLMKKKEEPPATAGIGDVQYFTYPQQNQLGQGEVDLTALDEIESQIAQSAAAYKNQQMSGMLPGNEGMESLLDPGDRNY